MEFVSLDIIRDLLQADVVIEVDTIGVLVESRHQW